jgi:hypothetical protein
MIYTFSSNGNQTQPDNRVRMAAKADDAPAVNKNKRFRKEKRVML